MKAREISIVRSNVVMRAVEFVDPTTGGRVVLPLELPGYNGHVWSWNGNVDNPTITPSVNQNPGQTSHAHYFVEAGHIRFLDDTPEPFKGRTVPMQPIHWERCRDDGA